MNWIEEIIEEHNNFNNGKPVFDEKLGYWKAKIKKPHDLNLSIGEIIEEHEIDQAIDDLINGSNDDVNDVDYD